MLSCPTLASSPPELTLSEHLSHSPKPNPAANQHKPNENKNICSLSPPSSPQLPPRRSSYLQGSDRTTADINSRFVSEIIGEYLIVTTRRRKWPSPLLHEHEWEALRLRGPSASHMTPRRCHKVGPQASFRPARCRYDADQLQRAIDFPTRHRTAASGFDGQGVVQRNVPRAFAGTVSSTGAPALSAIRDTSSCRLSACQGREEDHRRQ